MTPGQQRALRELRRLATQGQEAFLLADEPTLVKGWLVATVSLVIGAIETRDGGLDLREREEFVLHIPPDFPFDKPALSVTHMRFDGFPHVTWATWICLYQSSLEWQPSDGLFSFFERLRLWLYKAAINDMDPMEGPLEPPHHHTDFSGPPFVIRADAPCPAGIEWTGLALLHHYANRIELVGWDDLSGEWPTAGSPALAIFLARSLPMEFPSTGAELFHAFEAAGINREQFIRRLALAAMLSDEGQPVYLVVGLPMRRAPDGSQRTHVAVWSSGAETAESLRHVLPSSFDTEQILLLREDMAEALLRIFELSTIAWCPVLEDRPEIVIRRDQGTPVSALAGKTVVVLGCGALGSWLAEIVVRAKVAAIHVVDCGQVRPGLLVRQNFEADDIGSNKAEALVRRLRSIDSACSVVAHATEAHRFLRERAAEASSSDVVFDCTASSIFQMKLERDWGTDFPSRPALVSILIDARARHCLCVVVTQDSVGAVWDAYVRLKYQLCVDGSRPILTEAFYSDLAARNLFQPEPGCSDPTFAASTVEIAALLSPALSLASSTLAGGTSAIGIGLSALGEGNSDRTFRATLPSYEEVSAGSYRVRILAGVFSKARTYVRRNSRLRSRSHETGGLLWGLWDDACRIIWILDASGPPPDSRHDPALFVCGTVGTLEEHECRVKRTYGVCGFVGHWHTHPNLPSHQSSTDISTMATLVSAIGQNQKRSTMLIFGREAAHPTAGIYVYESQSLTAAAEFISIGSGELRLATAVV